MTPSMPSAMTTSATITSISVKPLAARIGEALLVPVVFGRRLGLCDHHPVALVLALLEAQVAVGQRRDAPQCRRSIALDVHLERHDVAARQHRDLRRPLLALVLLGAIRQSRLEDDLAVL